MEKTFFDEDLIKTKRLVSCPNCRSNFKISFEEVIIVCECGEKFCAGSITDFPEDFIWHPSGKY